jgi:hypothetical protein
LVPWLEISRVPLAASAIALGLSNLGVEDEAALDGGADRWGVAMFEIRLRGLSLLAVGLMNRVMATITMTMTHVAPAQRRRRRRRASRMTASGGELSARGRSCSAVGPCLMMVLLCLSP